MNDGSLDADFDLPDFLRDDDEEGPAPAASNKRPLADSSPDQSAASKAASAPFATGATASLGAPSMALKRSSDGLEHDGFGAAALHFGGRDSVGMGLPSPAIAQPSSGPVQPLRKRPRRGAAGETDDLGQPSSPGSHLTSPADSDHSSAPALTSPPSGNGSNGNGSGSNGHGGHDNAPVSSAVLRDQLTRFKVDSTPSSSASSSYGGTGPGTTPNWADQGLDDESQSQPVVIPGIAGRRPQQALDPSLATNTQDETSSPPRLPGGPGRLVRGVRPEEQPPLTLPHAPSSSQQPPYSTYPTHPLPPSSQHPPSSQQQQSPYFSGPPPQQQSPYGSPTLSNGGSFPTSMLPPPQPLSQSQPPAGGGGMDPAFDAFVVMMAGSFPQQALQHAWVTSGRDQLRAIAILVNQPQNGAPGPPPGPPGGLPSPQFPQQQLAPRQQPPIVQRPVQMHQMPMPMAGQPPQMRPPAPPGYSYQPQAQGYGGPGLQSSQGYPQPGARPPGVGPPPGQPGHYVNPSQVSQQQQHQIMLHRQQQAQQQQQQQYAAALAAGQIPPGARPPGAIPYPGGPHGPPIRTGQMYPGQPHPQGPPPPLLRPLGPGEPVTQHYINQLLMPNVLLSIPATLINSYVSPTVASCLSPAQKDALSKTWAQVQAHRTELQKRNVHANSQRQRQQQQQQFAHPQQHMQGGPRTGQPPRASGSGQPHSMQSLLSRSLAAVPYNPTPKRKKKKPTSDSDGDGGDYSDGSGDEYGGPTPAMIAKREGLAIEFFNACTKDELSELAGCSPTQATLVFKLRPFASPNDFRTRTRKQKGVGNNMLDNYLEVIEGMGEVDKVLSDCEQIGRELSHIMKIWATAGQPKAPPIAGQGQPRVDPADVGVSLTTIAEENVVQAAEASQDPLVREAFKDYIRTQPDGVPATIVLKDYQMLGLNWLNLLYRRKTSCILADDMGLGKTAQVISLIVHLKSKGEPGPHLVIVPSSTLENWMREFSVFAPSLVVQSYYGSQAERQEIRQELREMEDLDVVLTTYNIATSSPEDQKFLKRKMDFKICVFDEGHQLKNSESKKYKELMQIRAQWRLLLTGTPLQNNLQELVSLLSFILPDQFRDAGDALKAIFKVTPGAQANLLSRERISRAKKMMTPFVLRRKKAQVLKDLPGKSERVEWCEMTDSQRDVYNEAITRSKMALLAIQEEEIETIGAEVDVMEGEEEPKPKKRGPRASSTKTGNKSDQTSGSNVLMDLRKASNHPMLFRRLYTDAKLKLMSKDCLKEDEFLDRDKDLIFEDMEVMTDFELHRFCQGYKQLQKYCLKNDEWMSAGKIKTLQRLLPDLKKNGDRVLLFSQFTQVLDILELVLQTMDIKYLKLTGQTNVTERQGLVDEYTNDPDITVFLLSTRAGGLGLNLTSANTVILHDMDYNPHNDKQAEDRSYRIGQTRDVTVIKLITKGSLEEDMRALATMKLQLDESVSNSSQYPSGAGPPGAEAEGNSGQVEKKMRTSLLSNLKKRFEAESGSQQTQTQTQGTSPVKQER
ncbi:hypothetical protein RQP46_006775 [Phenoliferia psychrophenolica]